MRYKEIGPVPKDFHRVTNGTIRYLRETCGVALLDEVFRRMAHDVFARFCNEDAPTPRHVFSETSTGSVHSIA